MSIRVGQVVNEVSETVVRVGVATVVGGVAAFAVPVLGVPVVAGAVFCGATALVGKVVDAVLRPIFNSEGTSHLSHALGRVFTVLIAAGVGAAIASLAGFPITLVGGLAILGVIAIADLLAMLACKIVSSVGHAIVNHCNKHKHHHELTAEAVS